MMRTETICIQLPGLSNTINTGTHVMQYRYAKAATSGLKLQKVPYLLTFIKLVPVAGLEPARRFKVPGF
jgi:hypothetical protein